MVAAIVRREPFREVQHISANDGIICIYAAFTENSPGGFRAQVKPAYRADTVSVARVVNIPSVLGKAWHCLLSGVIGQHRDRSCLNVKERKVIHKIVCTAVPAAALENNAFSVRRELRVLIAESAVLREIYDFSVVGEINIPLVSRLVYRHKSELLGRPSEAAVHSVDKIAADSPDRTVGSTQIQLTVKVGIAFVAVPQEPALRKLRVRPAIIGIGFVLRSVSALVEWRYPDVVHNEISLLEIRRPCPAFREPQSQPETAFVCRDILCRRMYQLAVKVILHARSLVFIACVPVKAVCVELPVRLITAFNRLSLVVLLGQPSGAEDVAERKIVIFVTSRELNIYLVIYYLQLAV